MAIKKRSATVVPGASGAAAAIKNPPASHNSFWGELPQHVMSGISRMVPTLIMGGVILAFSQLIAYSWLDIPADTGIMDALNSGKFSGFNLSLLKFAWLSQSFGGVLFGFAIPMFAAFVANSIGGKLAFPAGFIGGLMSTQPTQILNFDPATLQWATSAPVPSTFIGALIISIVAGYLVKWMNQKIQLPDFLLAFKTTFLLPILSAIFVMLAMYYVITPFGGWINGGIRSLLMAAGEKGTLMYAMGISAATAIDLGGPINKAAGFVAFSFTTDHVSAGNRTLYCHRDSSNWPRVGYASRSALNRQTPVQRTALPARENGNVPRIYGHQRRGNPVCAGKPHHGNSILYGWRYCRIDGCRLAGGGAVVPGIGYLGMAAGH